VTGVAADQLDLDRASDKRDDWPGLPLQATASSCDGRKRHAKNLWISSFLTRERKLRAVVKNSMQTASVTEPNV
jgi:hypothetical protein